MHLDLLPSVLTLGVLEAGLYGLLPVAVVLTYRISRTIGFVHGGFAILGGLLYAVLVNGRNHDDGFGLHPIVGTWSAFVLVIGAGALGGALFGTLVMSRWTAELPGITLTVISIAGLLVVGNLSGFYLDPGGFSIASSPFGTGGTRVGKVVITNHRLATLLILVAIVVALTIFLNRTYSGLAIRAIADDVEASVWCGTKLRLIGTGVYGVSGAIASMAGALYAGAVAEAADGMLGLFVVGLLLAIVGGMRSVPLALAAALVYGTLHTALVAGMFGDVSAGWQQITLFTALLALIIVAARFRKESFFLLAGHQT
ncbi:MAG TPA: branched-chain amino acid ABC transporter permease [Sporichthyaceae bacterium]|jgi:branched-subunit amino acid ABC-type transport system permease component|nr:branched-chain amino acid ABC transporter permease [Sporichthyaceae bacterium]